jgi:hypothetical protein
MALAIAEKFRTPQLLFRAISSAEAEAVEEGRCSAAAGLAVLKQVRDGQGRQLLPKEVVDRLYNSLLAKCSAGPEAP